MELDPVAIATTLAIIVLTIAVSVFGSSLGKRLSVYFNHEKGEDEEPSLARVAEINVYPIKSCAEMRVDRAAVTPRGFRFDRTFQVVSQVDGAWSFCTPREKKHEKLFRVQPAISDDSKRLALASPFTKDTFAMELDAAPENSLVTTVMGGSKALLEDYGDGAAKWLASATGIDNPRLVGIADGTCFLRQVEVNPDQGEKLPQTSPIPLSLADEAPFLLTARESIVDLNKRLMKAGKNMVDMRRFRPNIVIEGLQPWEEDSVKRVRIGPVEFHAWQRCGRCTMTTIDRDTLERCGEPLSTLSTFRERKNGQRNFGMHLIPILNDAGSDDAVISVGDKVEILAYDEERKAEWERLFGKQ
ncbi:hypothetical protein ACHAWF_018237 [Thalassiosira exigua]